MLIDFNKISETTIPGMNGGTGEMSSKMYSDKDMRVISCRIHAGGSIGLHKHETGSDINFVISGTGKAICGGETEYLVPGTCHVCKKGSEHSIINTGSDDLVLLTLSI